MKQFGKSYFSFNDHFDLFRPAIKSRIYKVSGNVKNFEWNASEFKFHSLNLNKVR